MILPAIIDGPVGPEKRFPQVGESSQWKLFWNAQFATFWAGLRPDWALEAVLRPREGQPATRMDGERFARIPALAKADGVQIDCVVYESLPESTTLTGAVRITNSSPTAWPGFAEPAKTWATVVRMQLVSIVYENRPSFNLEQPDPRRQWQSLQPIAGTEWFYELARPPATLHTYRPPDGEPGQLRVELLLVDLDTGNQRNLEDDRTALTVRS